MNPLPPSASPRDRAGLQRQRDQPQIVRQFSDFETIGASHPAQRREQQRPGDMVRLRRFDEIESRKGKPVRITSPYSNVRSGHDRRQNNLVDSLAGFSRASATQVDRRCCARGEPAGSECWVRSSLANTIFPVTARCLRPYWSGFNRSGSRDRSCYLVRDRSLTAPKTVTRPETIR